MIIFWKQRDSDSLGMLAQRKEILSLWKTGYFRSEREKEERNGNDNGIEAQRGLC